MSTIQVPSVGLPGTVVDAADINNAFAAFETTINQTNLRNDSIHTYHKSTPAIEQVLDSLNNLDSIGFADKRRILQNSYSSLISKVFELQKLHNSDLRTEQMRTYILKLQNSIELVVELAEKYGITIFIDIPGEI